MIPQPHFKCIWMSQCQNLKLEGAVVMNELDSNKQICMKKVFLCLHVCITLEKGAERNKMRFLKNELVLKKYIVGIWT
jgi:hypothetical protein